MLWFLLVVVCTPAAAAHAVGAAPAASVRVELRGPLPFSAGTLRRAVAARVDRGAGLRVRVEGHAAGAGLRVAVSVERSARARRVGEVSLAETGSAEDAARAVALVVAELARPALHIGLPGDDAAAPTIARRAPPPTPRQPGWLRLAAWATVGSGVGGGQLRGGARLDATLRVAGPLRLLLGGGFDIAPSQQRGEVSLSAVSAAGRVGLALALWGDRLALRAWAVVQPFVARGRVGALDVGHTEVLVGGGAGALYALALTRQLSLVAALSAELFANRVELLVHGTPTMASDRLAFVAALGVRWSIGR